MLPFFDAAVVSADPIDAVFPREIERPDVLEAAVAFQTIDRALGASFPLTYLEFGPQGRRSAFQLNGVPR